MSESSGLGKHTTTASALYHLTTGGDLIDSPGVREFGLWNLPQEQVAAGFADLRAVAPECRFLDCRHLGEPGCAVADAIAVGKVSAQRYRNYRQIVASLGQQR